MDLRRLARIADVAVVGLLAASAQIEVWVRDASTWDNGPVVHATLAAVVTLPLLVRRGYPLHLQQFLKLL